jgi:hypothetical protein
MSTTTTMMTMTMTVPMPMDMDASPKMPIFRRPRRKRPELHASFESSSVPPARKQAT